MDRARAPWPIAIEAMGGAAAGAVVWRRQGHSFVTVILKATYKLVPEGVLVPAPALPVLATDLHHGDDPRRSLRASSDLAPYLRRVDVLLSGHACAPPSGPVQSSGVRLTMYRDELCVLDKALLVQGDRAQDANGRWFGVIPFQRIPLVYERATGSAEINPVGIDARFREPNLVHPRGWGLPACFGPVSPLWPSRRRHVAAFDPRAFDPPWLSLPDALDDRYFQTAPEDQQLDALRGDEWIVLEGMHPTLPRLRTRLPSARGVARVRGEAPGSSRMLELRADTLSIDMDAELCTLSFRAYIPLANEQILPALRVLVEPELPGTVKPMLGGSPVAPVVAQRSRPPVEAPGETAFVPSDLHATAKPAMPFAPVKQDLGATIVVPGVEAPGTPIVMPFAPVRQEAPSPFASPALTPAPHPAASHGETLFVPSDLPHTRVATPFEHPPESAAPMTLALPDLPAPAADLPPTLPFAPLPAPPPLLTPAPAPEQTADPEAPIEGLGAIFLGALPLPPEAPKKSARQRREDDGARAPRAR